MPFYGGSNMAFKKPFKTEANNFWKNEFQAFFRLNSLQNLIYLEKRTSIGKVIMRHNTSQFKS